MNRRVKNLLLYGFLTIGIFYFTFLGLYKAKEFLVPIAVGLILAMLLIPVSRRLEIWGFNRGWSSFFSTLILVGTYVGLFFITSSQIKGFVDDWPEIKDRLKPQVERFQDFVATKLGIDQQEQEDKLKSNLPFFGKSTSEEANGNEKNILTGIFTFFTNSLLVFVYVFFLLFYRRKFRRSILAFVPSAEKSRANTIIAESNRVAQNYLFGKFILIIILAVIYSLGLSIIGIRHAIFVAVLASVFTLVPYIGNVVGGGLAIMFGLFSGGGLGTVAGVLGVFTITQFIESYILEPFIVGHKVNLNPVWTIIGVVLGGTVWGIAGMVIAIPYIGIIKVISDKVPVLNPLGFILGEEGTGNENNFFEKIEDWISQKTRKNK